MPRSQRTTFDDFYRELERDAQAEGEFAVADLRAKELKYSLINSLIAGRQGLNLTQAALADRSGIAQTEISRIERGRKSPTLDTFSRLAGALGFESIRALKVGPPQARAVFAMRLNAMPAAAPLQWRDDRELESDAAAPASLVRVAVKARSSRNRKRRTTAKSAASGRAANAKQPNRKRTG